MLVEFGVVNMLPESSSWQDELSPSLSLTASEIMRNREAFDEDFVRHITFVADESNIHLDDFRGLRNMCL